MKWFQHATLLKGGVSRYSVILANSPVFPLSLQLWESAQFRILADGASVHMYEHHQTSKTKPKLPHYIVGDLDSSPTDVLDWWMKHGVQVVKDPDQDSNDLEKSLEVLKQNLGVVDCRQMDVVIGGVFGGRFDHELGAINVLIRSEHKKEFKSLTLLNQHNLACYIPPGKSTIECDLQIQGPTCGLIPLGKPCREARTKGLKWNLEGQSMQFGDLVSTSNVLDGSVVEIETSDELIWTTTLK
jgi:thiamine pyrophosphokinase